MRLLALRLCLYINIAVEIASHKFNMEVPYDMVHIKRTVIFKHNRGLVKEEYLVIILG